MAEHRYGLTRSSANKKTGPMAVSMTDRSSCPDACPMREKGCFANGWPLSLHWDRLPETGLTQKQFERALRKLPWYSLWRHDQAGDLPGEGDNIDREALLGIIEAADSRGVKGATYSHKPLEHGDNLAILREIRVRGLVVNVSANSPAHLDQLMRLAPDLEYAALIPEEAGKVTLTEDGNKIVWCPAQWMKLKGVKLTCADCGNGRPLCWRRDRNYAIGFKAHGPWKRWVEAMIRSWT
jgi:hypothetical protein